MSNTAIAPMGFIVWTLALLILPFKDRLAVFAKLMGERAELMPAGDERPPL